MNTEAQSSSTANDYHLGSFCYSNYPSFCHRATINYTTDRVNWDYLYAHFTASKNIDWSDGFRRPKTMATNGVCCSRHHSIITIGQRTDWDSFTTVNSAGFDQTWKMLDSEYYGFYYDLNEMTFFYSEREFSSNYFNF